MTRPKTSNSSKSDKLVLLLKTWIKRADEVAEISKWWDEHDEEVNDFISDTAEEKTLSYVLARYYADALETLRAQSLESLDSIVKLQESRHTREHAARVEAEEAAMRLIKGWRQKKNALADGRVKGVEARKKVATQNRTNLENAIAALFDKPEKPGWAWTNPQIVKFLEEKFTGVYTPGTVAQTVKREAAKFRKDRKQQLASQFLSR